MNLPHKKILDTYQADSNPLPEDLQQTSQDLEALETELADTEEEEDIVELKKQIETLSATFAKALKRHYDRELKEDLPTENIKINILHKLFAEKCGSTKRKCLLSEKELKEAGYPINKLKEETIGPYELYIKQYETHWTLKKVK